MISEAFRENKKNNDEEQVNHPTRYNTYPIEVIQMMERIWGLQKTIDFCLMTAFKYRMRLGHKDDIQQELAKEKWYLDYAENLNEKKKTMTS